MKFSVLISVYYKENAEFLKEALESVINQTVKPNQIILVKDGKLTKQLEDTIEQFCRQYKNLFKIVEIDKNVGLGNALQIGIKECDYEYIARMDSDDYSINTRFEKQIEYIKNNPKIDIVGANIDEYSVNMKNKLSTRKVPEKDLEIKDFLKKRNAFNHVTVMYKKESVLKAGNYEKCHFFEDYFLWCKMAQEGNSFYNIQESLVKVRAGDDMAKRRGGLNYCKHIINFEKKIKEIGFINKYQYLKNIIIRIAVSLIPNFFRTKLYEKKLRERN